MRIRITGITHALSFEGLPKDGTDAERLFVWLCHINALLPHALHLSDTEIYQLLNKLGESNDDTSQMP